ncbi:MAG: hypothetical protein A2887_03940 [Alphaproteobacteria bacterium RIFCSPLOWO2_01_FULL_40_26]|nr:MAG: hypothetical protein A3D15_04000 [Alphaproteobacteria bacterium RIFCSPHIGHO2_02_FULL_40_34]OFW94714.1 MAG: hypothetical protein A2887_03940 [Alphaproteobacteria bacterium RIFCSPLOWO2_01_FULL_40_26]OFX10346.1 MAG: hypothetical protein A3H30_05850 [Alphaproteobacteria bacterium RIFCSPLOWO2_02_FULL_40_19]
MDIIFFAALAFYIFFKLSKHLGRIDDEEKKQIEIKIAKQKAAMFAAVQQAVQQNVAAPEKVVGAASTAEKKKTVDDEILETLDAATRENLTGILQRTNMTAEFFLQGAKSAFEMVIKAFSAGDLEMLKNLLSEKIFSGFETAINQRKEQEKILITNLIAIEKPEIISAMMLENFASITVKFVSKQINYITSKEGQIIEGRKDEISEIVDIWTFKKDVISANPNWLVSSTN